MILIDEKTGKIEHQGKTLPLYSLEAFELISKLWVKMGWANKYSYQYTWLGRPIIQHPEDILKIQEVIYQIKPTLIIETGVAHGGSLIFYASLLKLINSGRIIGIDIDIREKNRKAIEQHELSSAITLIQGSSIDTQIIQQVQTLIKKDDVVLVLLDSNHSYAHVLEELKLYSPMVTPGSYIVATDGIMKDLKGAPGAADDWEHDNPQTAVMEFLETNKTFVLETPKPIFNESSITFENTYWPNAWLKKVK
ncbi:MAG: cephalosporin hydroxylase family protein [Candidatus Berkiellales bacterium]